MQKSGRFPIMLASAGFLILLFSNLWELMHHRMPHAPGLVLLCLTAFIAVNVWHKARR